MIAIQHTTTSLFHWRGATIALFPPKAQFYCYLVCYAQTPFHHAKHYLGCTAHLDERLQAHREGKGARLMEVLRDNGITWQLTRLWVCADYDSMRQLERDLKKQHNSPYLCPSCNPHLPPDPACLLRAGHFPFHLFGQGKRQPMKGAPVWIS